MLGLISHQMLGLVSHRMLGLASHQMLGLISLYLRTYQMFHTFTPSQGSAIRQFVQTLSAL